MRNYKIKKALNFSVPEYDAEALERTMTFSKNIDYGVEKQRMTEVQSILAQIKFIPMKAWAGKFAIACLLNAGILVETQVGNASLWMIISICIPLLCLTGTNEICNIMQPELKSLLLTVRYSMKKIILIRLLIFGVIDLLILLLTAGAAFFADLYAGWNDLLYVIMLYNLMCMGCIYIINHIRETNAVFACSVWGVSLITMNLIIKNTFAELVAGKENMILLLIIALTIWRILTEISNMLGGLQEHEINSQQFV
ncbi:hypothetical protein [Hespellia stercorisuis]|uniref:ABC-2 family transporter protein n=1 Tax=Hespellia stercorisuis DSM 15480 TaxID=1121950 RepID=A0A1M6N092_9FIRM|nr:hypothetical protein [Hespellia stercorisuis]SHJ89121.1 hypothetical protein SAMN02745243_01651 [Hespellia stercorisuis DSM 15480]